MDKFRFEDMKRGWFIGDFEPSAYKTKNFEVAVGHHKKGEIWDKHYHKLATEITVILEGKVKINDEFYVKGDVFVIEPDEIIHPHFIEETHIVVVKTISDVNDKYIVE